MPFRRRRRVDELPPGVARRSRLGDFLKRWMIPIIGAITPAGLIVVNISIFIAHHLQQFRWTIAILAFVSSIMLNSWAGLNIYRLFQARRPDHALVHERNQEVVLVAGMGLVIGAAFLTALFCYLGLSNEADLPNGLTFFTGVIATFVPIAGQWLFRRGYRRPPRSRSQMTNVAGLPPGGSMSPPAAPPVRTTIPRR